jgi:hypothetical protein
MAIMFLFTANIFPQDEPDIEIGRSYKFELIDNSQIIGKVISFDKFKVKIQTKYNGAVNIRRENILFISTDLTPEKYLFSFGLLGGLSYLNSGNNYSSYSYNTERGPHVDANAMFYFSNSKAIKLDLSFSTSRPDFNDNYYYSYYYNNPPPEPDRFEGGKATYFSFKPALVLGTFNPKEKILAYGSLGLGIRFFSRNEITHTYYSYNYSDSTYLKRIETIYARQETSVFLSVGGGLGFRVTPHLGILGEAEFNAVFEKNDFGSYIPLRIGINYIFY